MKKRKMLLRVTKRNVCGFTSVSEVENQRDRMEEIVMEGFLHIQNLGKYLETHLGILEDKQLPRTLCLAPHVTMGDVAFPLKTYLLKPSQDRRAEGTMRKAPSIICFPDPGEWWKMHLEY
jgi:hypothetical protein